MSRPGPPPAPDRVPEGGVSAQRSLLVWLIVGQLALHSAMAGQRMAAPLQALQAGHSAWAVGALLALFAALPVLTALPAGRLVDRQGYHRPQRLAAALTLLGAACALAGSWLPPAGQFVLAGLGACAAGAGTNLGVIVVQRSVGRLAADGTERLRLFSWLGMAFSAANVVGPVSAGLVIDAGGFAAAYALMLALPLVSLAVLRRVPAAAVAPAPPPPGTTRARRWDLLALPGMRRLLLVNWLLSASWDVHSFAVPVLGHQLGFSASTIGAVLGVFTASVTAVRFAIPLLAHRLSEVAVLRGAMLLTGLVFAAYPVATTPWAMAGCALLLGLPLGAVQPMVMSALHQLTPAARQGEAIALRSMAINLSSSAMPLVFGAVGSALGAGVLFWAMGAAVGAGSAAAQGLRRALGADGGGRPPAPPG